MDTQNIDKYINGLLEKMKGDGYSEAVIKNTTWILNFFKKYCINNNIQTVEIPVMVAFLKEKFDIDYYNPNAGMQIVLRRPLLILYEFYQSGSFCKTHQKERKINIPKNFSNEYLKYHQFVNLHDITANSKKRKDWIIAQFFMYLEQINITDLKKLKITHVDNYINTLTNYSLSTKSTICKTLREALDWMYKEQWICFTGRQAFPLIRKTPRTQILSYFTKEEIERILSCIDISQRNGIRDFAILSVFIYWGLRVSDVANLKLEYFDWNKNVVNIVQQKTGIPLSLPLIDEVKMPLIDYIKNERKESNFSNIFISNYAPHNPVTTSCFQRIVNKYVCKANIDYVNRHHGPHSLRHSLATNLMNNNVPISAISSVLGHSSTRTTEIYLTVDEKNLGSLALEVPNEK